MSVQKLSDSSKTILENVPYAQLSNSVIEHIKDNDAFRIYSYLSSKSRDWSVAKEWTAKKFNVSDRKSKQCWSYLERCGLIEYLSMRDEKGRFLKHDLRVLNGTKFNKDEPFIKEKITTGAETAPLEGYQQVHRCNNAPSGEITRVDSAPLLNKDITNKDLSNKKEREGVATNPQCQNDQPDKKPLSMDDFKTEEALSICFDKNLDFENEVKKFMNHYQGKETSLGKFINWLDRAKIESRQSAKNDSLDDYVRRFMRDTKCSEQEARDYYRERGYA